jgi:RNA polymerase sigma-70 factor (ECF subfamily)
METTVPDTVRRVLRGDRDAYGEIVRLHQDMLLAYAAYRLPDAALVDEVVQQTFIRAYEQLGDYDPSKDLGTWLRTICKFMILAELKRVSRDKQNRDTYKDRVRGSLAEAALERADGADPDDLRRLKSCIDQLQKTSRELVKARYLQALPLGDIARKFGQSAAWVATTLFRVRDTLRRCLEQQEAGA